MKNKVGLHFLLCLLLFSGVSTLGARQPIKLPPKPPVKVNEIQILINKIDALEDKVERQQRYLAESKEIQHIIVKYGNNPDGMSALHYAIKLGDANAVNLLIANGADVNSKDGNFTALTRAASCNQYEIAQILLSLGADVNLIARRAIKFRESSTCYALNYAVEFGSANLVTLLIENGAILDRSVPSEEYGSIYPRSPLHTAVIVGNYEAVIALVSSGAQIDGIAPPKGSIQAPNGNETTPLDDAAIHLKYSEDPQNLELIKYLVENGATRRFVHYYKPGNGSDRIQCSVISGYLESMGR